MFCNQCEQTAKGTGCTIAGVCGKTGDVAALQDLLTNATRGLATVDVAAEALGIDTTAAGAFTADALFTTLTNVDFDPARLSEPAMRKLWHWQFGFQRQPLRRAFYDTQDSGRIDLITTGKFGGPVWFENQGVSEK